MHISKVLNEKSLLLKRTLFNKAAIIGLTNTGEHFVAHVLASDEFHFSHHFQNIFTKEAYQAEKYKKPKLHTKQAIKELTAWYAAQPAPEFENLPAVLSEISYDDCDLEGQNRLIISCVVNDFEEVQYDVDLIRNELVGTYEDHSNEHLQYLMLDGEDMKTLEIEKRILLQIESELTAFLKANPYDLSDFTDERHHIYENSLSIDRNRYNEIQISGRTFNGDGVYAEVDKDGDIRLKNNMMQNHSIFSFEMRERLGQNYYYRYYTEKALADLKEWFSKQTITEANSELNLSGFRYRFSEDGEDVILRISALVNGCEEVSYKIDIDTNSIDGDEVIEDYYEYISIMPEKCSDLALKDKVDKQIINLLNSYIKENPHSLTYK